MAHQLRSDGASFTPRFRSVCAAFVRQICSDSATFAQRCVAFVPRFRSISAALAVMLRWRSNWAVWRFIYTMAQQLGSLALYLHSIFSQRLRATMAQRWHSDGTAMARRWRSDGAAIMQRRWRINCAVMALRYTAFAQHFRSVSAVDMQRWRSNCAVMALCLQSDFAAFAPRLCIDGTAMARRLRSVCAVNAQRLRSDHIAIAQRLRSVCAAFAQR
jgi:hypothetical protein